MKGVHNNAAVQIHEKLHGDVDAQDQHQHNHSHKPIEKRVRYADEEPEPRRSSRNQRSPRSPRGP